MFAIRTKFALSAILPSNVLHVSSNISASFVVSLKIPRYVLPHDVLGDDVLYVDTGWEGMTHIIVGTAVR